MNETSASVPRADRKHTPRLTWRAWVARVLVSISALFLIPAASHGAVVLERPAHEHLSVFDFLCGGVALVSIVVGITAAIMGCVFFVIWSYQHFNERK